MWFYKAVQLNITSLKSSGKPVATAQSQPGLRCGKFTPPLEVPANLLLL